MSIGQLSIKTALQQAQSKLISSDTARLDTELLLAHTLEKNRSYLFAHPEQTLTDTQGRAFFRLLEQRILGRPVAYLLGEWEFWGLPLKLNEHCLIPRPETELLVELILQQLDEQPKRVADLGTGSGAIALALAKARPNWHLVGVEKSAAALQIAEHNRRWHGLHNLNLVNGDWCSPLESQSFDLIVANPPYLGVEDPHLKRGDLRFEPASALVAAEQGLRDIRTICEQATRCLTRDGWLLIEHGYDQAKAAGQLFSACHYQQIECIQDLAHRDRVTRGRRPPAAVTG